MLSMRTNPNGQKQAINKLKLLVTQKNEIRPKIWIVNLSGGTFYAIEHIQILFIVELSGTVHLDIVMGEIKIEKSCNSNEKENFFC